MNSIFIRIYGGMLASLFIVSVISYLFIVGQSNQFNGSYPNNLIRGTLFVLGEGLGRTHGPDRLLWYAKVQEQLPAKIRLVSAVQSNNSREMLKKLYRGEIIITSNSAGSFEGWILSPKKENLLIHVSFAEFNQQHFTGIARLLVDELDARERSRWESSIKLWQKYFGTRLNLVETGDLDQEQQQELLAHQFWQQLAVGVVGKPVLTLMASIPSSGETLAIGPVHLADVLPYEMFVIYAMVAIVIMGLASYCVVRPLLRRLLRLEETVVKIRRHDLSARVTVDSNDMLGRLAATFNDMAEHIQRLISSQREMTNAVSHELRTPVARIRFGLEFLEDEDSQEARGARIQDIDEDIQELERLIDEILTYASLEEGTPSLKLQMIRIDDILAQVKRESDNLGRSTMTVEHIPTKEQGDQQFAECEERYIHRVVQNLVGNAMNYGNSTVRISSACEGGMYRIDVEDDGPGIPEDKIEKVFVPFARLDDSRTRSSGGYGLGLSIVQRIAYWHGGLASVSRSTLGGARFTVLWPRTQSMRQAAKERSSNAKVENSVKGALDLWRGKKSA